MTEKCRYFKCGICTTNGEICNDCKKQTKSIQYKYSYNPFNGATTISIVNEKGHKYISAEIYGQLSDIAIKSYAIDLCKILIDKGVIK